MVSINHERHYGLWKVYGYYADNFTDSYKFNKFSSFNALFTLFTEHAQTEQNQNGM